MALEWRSWTVAELNKRSFPSLSLELMCHYASNFVLNILRSWRCGALLEHEWFTHSHSDGRPNSLLHVSWRLHILLGPPHATLTFPLQAYTQVPSQVYNNGGLGSRVRASCRVLIGKLVANSDWADLTWLVDAFSCSVGLVCSPHGRKSWWPLWLWLFIFAV